MLSQAPWTWRASFRPGGAGRRPGHSTRADIIQGADAGALLRMGIAEQNMVGVAAGMATLGFVPWPDVCGVYGQSAPLDQVRIAGGAAASEREDVWGLLRAPYSNT